MNDKIIDGSVAILRLGESRIAGIVSILKDKAGQTFASFYTGHSNKPFPIIFMEKQGAFDYELTGLRMPEFAMQNDGEIDAYYAFAMHVFEQNLQPDEYDFYAALNAAIWLRDSGLVTKEDYTVAPLDVELVHASAMFVLESKGALDMFVEFINRSSESVVVH